MGLYAIPDSLEADIKEYENTVNDYIAGKINKVKMKSVRVPMGVYEQRQDGSYMVRVRVPGGDITPQQLESAAALAQKYTQKPLHVTTRQELQLHGVKLPDTYTIMKRLKGIGLSTRGGGGNTVRNITGSFDEGIDPGEVFSITPYVRALTERMIAEPDSWVLPRKFKIAFSGSAKDTALACANDLGFMAKINAKGEKGFEVYIAGGMGGKPAVGTLLYDFVPHAEVYNITKAAKQLFDRHGNRKNKHAARLRFVLYRLGKEDFFDLFEKTLEEVRAKNYPQLELKEAGEKRRGHALVPLFLGDLSPENAENIAAIAAPYGEETIRLTPGQDLLIRNLPEDAEHDIINELKRAGIFHESGRIFDSAIVCAGAGTCRLGICLSRGMLSAAKEAWRERGSAIEKLAGVSIRVSGCPNSCAGHLAADIGFYGTALRRGEKLAPGYYVAAGAQKGAGKTKFAAIKGAVPAKYAPSLLVDALEHAAKHRKDNEEFSAYMEREGVMEIERLAGIYSSKTDAPDIYTDWGAQKEFSLADKMEGECSAGVFDLIDNDLASADSYLAAGDAAGAVAAASGALLITKGLEAKGPADAVSLFRENFLGKHLPAEYGDVIAAFLEQRPVDEGRAAIFIAAVRSLYDAMDNSLRFPEAAETQKAAVAEKKEFRDFRGVKCPMNFVKTKLVLEGMKAGEKLEILLDDGEPIENVPASLKNEGHEVLEQKKTGGHWSVLIKKT